MINLIVKNWRDVAFYLVLIGYGLFCVWVGQNHIQKKWNEEKLVHAQAEIKHMIEVVKLQDQVQSITNQIDTKAVETTVKYQVKKEYTTKEVIKYVQNPNVADCSLPNEFVWLYNPSISAD